MIATALTLFVGAVAGRPLAIGGIHAYQRLLAPMTSRLGIECRFTPSCSRYGEIAIARDGVLSGGWQAVRRVARCHPWTPEGTIDEP